MTQKPTNKVNTRKSILQRSLLVFSIIGLGGLYILYTIVQLQNGFDKEFSIEIQKKNTRVKDVLGLRGNIYAADGSLLATSVPTYDLIWDPNADGLTKEKFRAKIDSLSLMFSKEFKEKSQASWKGYFIAQFKKKNNRYALIKKDLSFDIVKRLKTFPLFWMGKFKGGFYFAEHGKRMYFMGDLAKRAIGYTKNGVSVGLEGAFDSLLRGKAGRIMEQRLPGNVWRPVNVGNHQPAENGFDIVTTLDVQFQDITQYALNKSLTENQADHGCAMVMDIHTGAIKAIANLKQGSDGKYFEAQNYAVDQFVEPGSTFKLISVLSLLEDGLAKPTDSVYVYHNKAVYYGKPITDGDHAPHKKYYTLKESFEKSSNVGISQFVWNAYSKKPENFTKHAIELGLDKKPEFDIPGANHPLIKSPSAGNWEGPVTLASMSIGYSAHVSPLQTLMLYSAVANHGKMMNPYLVQEIRQDGHSIKEIKPKVIIESICSEPTRTQLMDMLKGVTTIGTGKEIGKACNFPIAGKTGTARINQGGKAGYLEGKFMSSFVGFFPADSPQYSIIVVINEPKEKYYGADVAGPVFSDIANRIYSSHIKLQPELATASITEAPTALNGKQKYTRSILNELGVNTQANNPQSKWCKTQSKGYQIKLQSIESFDAKIPNFEGMGIRDALQLANQLGLKISYQGYGRVISQNIPAGSILSANTIHLILKPF